MKVVATVHLNWMDLIKQEAAKRKGKKKNNIIMKSRIQIILYTKTKPKLNNTIVSGVILKFLFVKIHFK